MRAALLLALFAGKARGAETPGGATHDWFSLVAGQDKPRSQAFHKILSSTADGVRRQIQEVHGFDDSADIR